jgi:hypothetical protein
VDQCQARLLGRCVSERNLAVTHTFAAGVLPLLHQVPFRFDGHDAVADFGRELRGFLTADADNDWNWILRQVVDACAVDVKKLAIIGANLAAPQQANDLTASCSIACRWCTAGQPWPTTCSLRRSPAPRASVKPTLAHHADRRCRWATIAGW